MDSDSELERDKRKRRNEEARVRETHVGRFYPFFKSSFSVG